MTEKYNEEMRKILASEWNDKPVWELIKDKVLTAAPGFKGDLYDSAKMKIMYVGHAVNGWEELDASACKNADEVFDAIINQEKGIKTLANPDKVYRYISPNSGKERVYRHINSNFWRLIKEVLENLGESDIPSLERTEEESWYHDSKRWNEKIVWSNLYNIAPRAGGNPEGKFIKPHMASYVEMFKEQLIEFRPDIAIVCPLMDQFTPWKREPAFNKYLSNYDYCKKRSVILGTGTFNETKVIVCRRPDARGKSRKAVCEMAKEISDYITQNVK